MPFIGTSIKNGKAHVLELANRSSLQKIEGESLSAFTTRIDNHESGLNTNAHGITNIAGLQTALSGKEPVFSKNTAFNKNFGNTAGTVCQGNDSRLSDSRTPTTHSHVIGDVSGLQSTLDEKANSFIGYNGSFSVVTGVNFAGQSVTTKTITVSNGIITSVV